MVFSSFTFFFYFLPIVFSVYHLIRRKYKNLFLLLASYFFYAWGSEEFLLVLFLSTVLDYLVSFYLVPKMESKRWFARLVLSVGIVYNLGFLLYYKYSYFFVSEFGQLFGIEDPMWLKVALPLGISFFTFQKMSFLIDVYRKEAKAPKRFTDYALYIALFPQLIAGPIVRFSQIHDQLQHRKHSIHKIFTGIYVFVLGLSMKVLIADPLGLLHAEYAQAVDPSISVTLIGIVAYSFQIYFDFAGYSRMAIGLGKMFGFELPQNFNRPYLSRSITEFWRRWHMTLSDFVKQYVYFPMGGNRVSTLQNAFNLLFVFLIIGIWHGANWTFFLWGLYFGVIIVIEKLALKSFLEDAPVFFGRLYTYVLVFFGWILFQASSLQQALAQMVSLLQWDDVAELSLISLNNKTLLLLIVAALLSFVSFENKRLLSLEKKVWVRGLILFALLPNCILSMVESFSPFLYFRF